MTRVEWRDAQLRMLVFRFGGGMNGKKRSIGKARLGRGERIATSATVTMLDAKSQDNTGQHHTEVYRISEEKGECMREVSEDCAT